VLDATGSIDPRNDIVSYAWDLNGDGVYDDARYQSSVPCDLHFRRIQALID